MRTTSFDILWVVIYSQRISTNKMRKVTKSLEQRGQCLKLRSIKHSQHIDEKGVAHTVVSVS